MHYSSEGIEEGKGSLKLNTFRRILPFFKGKEKPIKWSMLAIIIATTFGAMLPLVLRELIDTAIPSKKIDLILMMSGGYLFLLIANEGITYFQSLLVGYVGIDIVNEIKQKLFKHALKLPVKFFDHLGSGKLISRIESDSQQLFMLFSSVGIQLLSAVLTISFSLIIMCWVSWKLTLFILAISPIYVGGAYIFFSKMRPMYRKDRELYANISGFLGEHIPAIRLLHGLSSIPWSLSTLAKHNQTKFKYGFKIHLLESSVWFVLMLTPQLVITAILYKSVTWIKADLITIGTIWMFIQYIYSVLFPIMRVSEQIGELQRAAGAADRIFEILDTELESIEFDRPPPPLKFEHSIEFKEVYFHYEVDKPVLKNISFKVNKGETIAFVGATGSGKTTIMSLLSRFYDPIEGEILIDGINIQNYTKEQLRRKMSIILQDIFLFPANVKENLKALRNDIEDEQAYSAANQLGVDKFINRWSDKYETDLFEEGSNLSFGERQLLSFTRSLTFSPEILIMDEATSSVDPYTEKLLQNSMSKLMKNRTSLIIAHRLSTITDAHRILVIDKGELVEEGTHHELIKQQGRYAKLHQSQQELV